MFDAFISHVRQSLPLQEDAVDLIRLASEERRVSEGEYLLRPGHTARELFFITGGILSIVVEHATGRDATCYFLKENHFCTILESFHQQVPAEEGIRGACAAEVVVFRRDNLLALYERLPGLRNFVDQSANRTLLEKVKTRNAYLGLDAAARYQVFLERQPEIAGRVSLSDTASYLEVTPQSLSRIRKNRQ
jgi:CRP-like cAMP-binding protein